MHIVIAEEMMSVAKVMKVTFVILILFTRHIED